MTPAANTGGDALPAGTGRTVDYLLVAGPGRSGSTYLHALLAGHAGFAAPPVKEAAYYRSRRRFARARRLAAPAEVVLDSPQRAWRDPALARLLRLRDGGCRVLVVLLLRDAVERARSVIAFRASRGHWRALAGGHAPERGALRESIGPADLERLFGLGANVACIEFAALTADPAGVVGTLARLCGVAPAAAGDAGGAVNGAERARSPWLSAGGKLAAMGLRAFGGRLLLARLKASARVRALFFRPRAPGAGYPGALSPGAQRGIAARWRACLALLEARGEPAGPGVRLVRPAAAPAPGP